MTKSWLSRHRREDRAEKDAEWFYGTLGGQVPPTNSPVRDRALAIEAALQSIPPFHRGALTLWHRPKTWPEALEAEFGQFASLVVRLECARTPSVGSTEALEAAAVVRLCDRLAGVGDADEEALDRLLDRARRHLQMAIRSLAKAQAARASDRDEAPISGVFVAGTITTKESA